MVDITFYSDFEEMSVDLGRAMKEADSRVNPTQAGIKPGQYFINFRHGPELPIFGEILDIKILGADEEEQAYLDEDYGQPHMKYYKPCRGYSVVCESGEYGDVHLSEVDYILDHELFRFYRDNGWTKPHSNEF